MAPSDWLDPDVARRTRAQRGPAEVVTVAPNGPVMVHAKITLWPQHAAAELAGALRAGLQGSGSAGQGATWTIGWIFEQPIVRMICLTVALDNVRSIRLIDRMGFRRMGERDGIRPDGTTRRSHDWEMTREEWDLLKCGARGA